MENLKTGLRIAAVFILGWVFGVMNLYIPLYNARMKVLSGEYGWAEQDGWPVLHKMNFPHHPIQPHIKPKWKVTPLEELRKERIIRELRDGKII